MQLNKSQAEFLQKTIDDWQSANLLSKDKATELKESFQTRSFDWKALARYAFVIAIVCGIVSVIAMFADKKLIAFLENLVDQIYNAPNFILAIICAVLASLSFYFGQKRKVNNPDKIFSNEGFLLLGITFSAFAFANLAKLVGTGDIYYITSFLLAALVYFAIALWLRSSLIWLFGLLGLGAWYIVQIGAISHWNPLFLGLNLAIRFLLFCLICLIITSWLKIKKWFQPFIDISIATFLLLFFISLWLCSVFGNFGNWENWNKVSQWHFWPWALLSILIAATTAYLGWKKNNMVLRGFGITFLFINVYTRYFEYFWNYPHKVIFFLVLALSFWFIGQKAEKIWNMDFLKNRVNIHNSIFSGTKLVKSFKIISYFLLRQSHPSDRFLTN